MENIMNFLMQYGLWAAFILIFLEYACFPLPSEVVLPFSGALAAATNSSFTVIFLGSILCALLGSLVCYYVGRMGGDAFFERILRKHPSIKKGMDASRRNFQKYSAAAVCVTRVIPVCRTYISVIAGMSRQDLSSFLLFSAAGIAVWNGALLYLGYILEHNYRLAGTYYSRLKWPVLIGAIILALVIFLLRKNKKIKNQFDN